MLWVITGAAGQPREWPFQVRFNTSEARGMVLAENGTFI
jgi:hypothetical protein